MGKIVHIFTCPHMGEPMEEQQKVVVEEGRGIVGDRYYYERGFWSDKRVGEVIRHVSIISLEAIEEMNRTLTVLGRATYDPSQTRRNFVVQGYDGLNGLVGREFTLDGVHMRGNELATPCHRPAQLLERKDPGFMQLLVATGGGGLRAETLSTGEVGVGGLLAA